MKLNWMKKNMMVVIDIDKEDIYRYTVLIKDKLCYVNKLRIKREKVKFLIRCGIHRNCKN